ncbi:MAG: MFS transporter [Acidimicrobiia bacterium]|nr:MFS transporter [Acidimicrobiia bacterium]
MAHVKNDRRTIFGWSMYDWANSAYSTTIAGAILPAYFADSIVPDGGYEVFGWSLSGESLWGLVVGFGAFFLFLVTPVLGAIADFSASKKRFLVFFAYGGAVFTCVLWFMTTGDVLLTLTLFFLAQLGFVSANVFYDGFLPDITTEDTIDKVSARGFALGYIGGGLQLALALVLILLHETLGITEEEAARWGILMAGLWWAGFSWYAFRFFRETGEAQELPEAYRSMPRWWAYGKVGFDRTWHTARKLLGFRQLLLFLIAYMLYNDGVQTTINMSAVYATDTLKLESETIALAFLVVQFIAFGGALFFGRLAGRIGAKNALLVSLVIWSVIAVLAFFLPEGSALPFFGVAALIGLVLGGVQALSRSLYGSMIPEEASAEFYGFFSVFSKFSAMWGPLIFAGIAAATDSGRPAILSIIVFFILGGILLWRTDIDEARASKDQWSFEGVSAG